MKPYYRQGAVGYVTTHPKHSGVYRHVVNHYWIINTAENTVFFIPGNTIGLSSPDYKRLEQIRSTDPDLPADTHIEKLPVVYIDCDD